MDERYREVRFDAYCEKCKYKDKSEEESPCDVCLDNPLNLYSQKPVNWKGIEGFEDYIASEGEEKK